MVRRAAVGALDVCQGCVSRREHRAERSMHGVQGPQAGARYVDVRQLRPRSQRRNGAVLSRLRGSVPPSADVDVSVLQRGQPHRRRDGYSKPSVSVVRVHLPPPSRRPFDPIGFGRRTGHRSANIRWRGPITPARSSHVHPGSTEAAATTSSALRRRGWWSIGCTFDGTERERGPASRRREAGTTGVLVDVPQRRLRSRERRLHSDVRQV
jgi:hypothetical protein